MTPPDSPFKCPRRVGFLFPHDCQRSTPLGCPDCQNGQIEDPYAGRNRYYYSSYDYYDDYYWGSSYWPDYDQPQQGMGMSFAGDPADAASPADAPDSAVTDFTEADGADLVKTGDDFENDMTGS